MSRDPVTCGRGGESRSPWHWRSGLDHGTGGRQAGWGGRRDGEGRVGTSEEGGNLSQAPAELLLSFLSPFSLANGHAPARPLSSKEREGARDKGNKALTSATKPGTVNPPL